MHYAHHISGAPHQSHILIFMDPVHHGLILNYHLVYLTAVYSCDVLLTWCAWCSI